MTQENRSLPRWRRWLKKRSSGSGKRKRPSEHVRHLLDLIGHLRIDVVIDVGANEGQFGHGLREAGYTGRIVSFEPSPLAFGSLERTTASDPLWDCHPLALGRRSERHTLSETRSTQLSSLRPLNAFAADVFAQQAETTARIELETRSLDAVWEEMIACGSSPRGFLKLDTQGFDLEVFHGARPRLDSIWGLQSELSISPLYEGMPDYLETLAVYRSAGFEVTGFFPIFRDESTQILGEVDCTLAKPVAGERSRRIEIRD